MKRIICLLGVLLLLTTPVFADYGPSPITGINWKTYTIVNSTAGELITNVSTSDFLLSYRILGWKIIPEGASSGLYAIFYDAASGISSLDNRTLEDEILPTTTSVGIQLFPYPKQLMEGLTIVQGFRTRVIIYYVEE